jgi:hypothetical protein
MMSLMQQARRCTRAAARSLKVSYGRWMPYSAAVDKLNRQPLFARWRQENSHVPSLCTREDMWSFITNEFPAAIDYLEFGVYRGHSILFFAGRNNSTHSRFWGFDSFNGLPEDWSSEYKRGDFDTGGCVPETTDTRVSFIAGLFQETLPKFVSEYERRNHQVIVHIDCDLYSSTLYCLTKLDAILPSGTIVIFDEFGSELHEFRAANDYFASYRRGFKVICSHDSFCTIAGVLL